MFFIFSKYKKLIFPFLLSFLCMDSVLKFKADSSFKIAESNMIYDFLDLANLYNQGTIYIEHAKSLKSAHKYNMVVKASEFYFITDKSNFKFKFGESKTLSEELDSKLETLIEEIK